MLAHLPSGSSSGARGGTAQLRVSLSRFSLSWLVPVASRFQAWPSLLHSTANS